MRILIATGIFPPDIGGPAEYAKNLKEEFSRQGNGVKVVVYKLERKLPTFIRHCLYFFRIIFPVLKADLVVAFDTFSVGFPSVLAAKIFGKKIITRIGGDFLWESYVERSGNLVTLGNFYEAASPWSKKEKMIFFLTKFVLQNCSALIFTTEWQKKIFEKAYSLNRGKNYVIENFYGEKIPDFGFREKNFLWAGRVLKLKNLENLKSAIFEVQKESGDVKLEISGKVSHDELLKKIQSCYAVILPSLADISPNFILDAIRANKPFILTRETGFYDKLKDIGIFVDPLDATDIKNKILFLTEDQNYREYKKRVEAFNFIRSWRQIADEFLAVYKKL